MCSQVVSFHSHTSSLREMRLYSLQLLGQCGEVLVGIHAPSSVKPEHFRGYSVSTKFSPSPCFLQLQLLPSILVIFTCLTTLPYSYLGSFYFRFCLGYGVCFIWIQLPFVSYPSSFLFFPFKPPREKKKKRKSFRPVFRFCFPVRSSRQAVVRQLQQPIRPLDKPIRSNHLSIYRNGANQWRYGALERLVSTISGFLNLSISAASIPLLW